MSTFISKLSKELKIPKVDAKKPLAISVKPRRESLLRSGA